MFCTEKLKLYTGAKIVTLYDPMPIVEAVCVIGERIHAIGSLEDMERYAALCGEYEKIDLGGGVLYPGFIDTHSRQSNDLEAYSRRLHATRRERAELCPVGSRNRPG